MADLVLTPAAPAPTGELKDVAAAAAASVTPAMVDRLAQLAERATTALDLLASPEVLALLAQLKQSAPALTTALARMEQLANTGALDTLLELADLVHAARSSMTDGMVARLADTARQGLELVDTVMQTGLPARLPAILAATEEANGEAQRDTHFVSPLDVLKAPREPEIQYMLRFLLAFTRRLPKALQD